MGDESWGRKQAMLNYRGLDVIAGALRFMSQFKAQFTATPTPPYFAPRDLSSDSFSQF